MAVRWIEKVVWENRGRKRFRGFCRDPCAAPADCYQQEGRIGQPEIVWYDLSISKYNVRFVRAFFNNEKEVTMKVNVTKAVLSVVVLLSATITTPVFAASQNPEKMTCEEFLALDDVTKPKIVYWVEGFNNRGEPVDSVVDVDETDKLVPVLIAECKETPKQTLSEKIKKHLSAANKPAATKKSMSTHKPAKMTCEEFVALEDVVKPKVVYWAEGFNKKDKPADSDIDVIETDKLVPMLVTECKETPKLSFWEKIKSYF